MTVTGDHWAGVLLARIRANAEHAKRWKRLAKSYRQRHVWNREIIERQDSFVRLFERSARLWKRLAKELHLGREMHFVRAQSWEQAAARAYDWAELWKRLAKRQRAEGLQAHLDQALADGKEIVALRVALSEALKQAGAGSSEFARSQPSDACEILQLRGRLEAEEEENVALLHRQEKLAAVLTRVHALLADANAPNSWRVHNALEALKGWAFPGVNSPRNSGGSEGGIPGGAE